MAEIETKILNLNNGKNLSIRTAKKKDAQKLVGFVRQVTIDSNYLLLSGGEFSMTVEQEASWIQSNLEDPGAIILIGEIDSEIVAITNAKNGNRKRNAHIAHLGTSVAKKYRGQGIGRTMMKELCDWARKHPDIEYLDLSVMGDNTIAFNMYKSLGFKKVAEIPNSYKYEDGSYQTDIVMRLRVFSSYLKVIHH